MYFEFFGNAALLSKSGKNAPMNMVKWEVSHALPSSPDSRPLLLSRSSFFLSLDAQDQDVSRLKGVNESPATCKNWVKQGASHEKTWRPWGVAKHCRKGAIQATSRRFLGADI